MEIQTEQNRSRELEMNIAEYERAIKRLMNWIQKAPVWQERWSAVHDRHLGDIPDALQIPDERFEALLGVLGGEMLSAIDPVIAEDFFTYRFAPDAANVIDAYLTAAGWKENAVSRSFMEALRDSHLGFYEIVGAVADTHWVVKEAGTDAEPKFAVDPQADGDYDVGSHMAARLLPVEGALMLADGVYFFQPDETVGVLEALKVESTAMVADLPGYAASQGLPLDETTRPSLERRMMASVLTVAWLLPMCVDALGDPDVQEALDSAEETSEL
jgi:hypothetical protein